MPEYIERKAAAQILRKEAANHYPTPFHVGLLAAARVIDAIPAADAIEELSKRVDESIPKADAEIIISEVAKSRWIPVKEQLPECDLGAEVGNIEWINCGMVHAGCFGRGGKYRDAYFRTWTDAGEGIDAKDADYWRAVTLPEPPKEE